MKVIDLLNKIAKGEEVPKKIITLNSSFKYNEYDNDYYCGNTSLFTELVGATDLLEEVTPVEIMEEDKKIEKINNGYTKEAIEDFKLARFNSNDMKTICNTIGWLMQYKNDMSNKIDELIDEVNKLKKGK